MGFLKKLVKETQSKDKDKYRKIYKEFAENYVNIFKERILEEAQKGYSLTPQGRKPRLLRVVGGMPDSATYFDF